MEDMPIRPILIEPDRNKPRRPPDRPFSATLEDFPFRTVSFNGKSFLNADDVADFLGAASRDRTDDDGVWRALLQLEQLLRDAFGEK